MAKVTQESVNLYDCELPENGWESTVVLGIMLQPILLWSKKLIPAEN